MKEEYRKTLELILENGGRCGNAPVDCCYCPFAGGDICTFDDNAGYEAFCITIKKLLDK